MGRYWIRNRGRVQGPFTEDRIQGLLRRGRFSRSFHVSQDNKSWYPASEFPELFAGVGRFGSTADEGDSPFQTAISPFDDDDRPPAKVRSSGGRSAAQRRAAPVQDTDDDEDEAWEDDDGSEDEDWEDDSDSGAVGRVLDWVETHVKAIVVLLVLALGVAGWFVFGRESFAKDTADLETLIEIKTRINAAHTMGAQANQWLKLADETEAALAPMVDRLTDQASSRDHVKQELLFAARDDIPQALKELPNGIQLADQRLNARFSRIEDMIRQQARQHPESVLSLPPQTQAASPPPSADASATTEQQSPASETSSAPTGAPTSAVPPPTVPPGAAPANATPDMNDQPASGMAPTAPNSTPPTTSPAANPAAAPANPAPPANAVPGRPQPAKF